jgi:hypothetical protein
LTKSKFALVTATLVAALAATTTTAVAAQTPAAAPAKRSAIVTFRVGDTDKMRVRFTDAADIATAKAQLNVERPEKHPHGEIVWGSTDVNTGHSWHLRNAHLVDISMELCDGELDKIVQRTWNVPTYCPWNAVVVAVDE